MSADKHFYWSNSLNDSSTDGGIDGLVLVIFSAISKAHSLVIWDAPTRRNSISKPQTTEPPVFRHSRRRRLSLAIQVQPSCMTKYRQIESWTDRAGCFSIRSGDSVIVNPSSTARASVKPWTSANTRSGTYTVPQYLTSSRRISSSASI